MDLFGYNTNKRKGLISSYMLQTGNNIFSICPNVLRRDGLDEMIYNETLRRDGARSAALAARSAHLCGAFSFNHVV